MKLRKRLGLPGNMGKGRTGRWLLKRNEEIEGVVDMKISGVSFWNGMLLFYVEISRKSAQKNIVYKQKKW